MSIAFKCSYGCIKRRQIAENKAAKFSDSSAARHRWTASVKISPPLPGLPSIDRSQLLLRFVDVEGLIDEDHSARSIWQLTGRLDLNLYHAEIASVEGSAGRDHTSPQLLGSPQNSDNRAR
jgi:hypothetical protein